MLRRSPLRLLALLAYSILHIGAVNAADDAIRTRLDRAKTAYLEAVQEYEKNTRAWFARREMVARKQGNKEEVDRIKNQEEAFETDGTTPVDAPASLKTPLETARSSMEAAYRSAIRDYTRMSLDDEAAAAEAEMKALKANTGHQSDGTTFQGKKYRVYETMLTWHAAKTKCEEMGGRLAVLDTQKKNDFAKELLAKSKVETAWIGATDEKKEGEWRWVTGKKIEFQAWAKNQPNNKEGLEHYAMLVLDARFPGWSDQPDSSAQHRPGFICEWD